MIVEMVGRGGVRLGGASRRGVLDGDDEDQRMLAKLTRIRRDD